MSEVRVSVEWIFGDVVNCFQFLDFKKNLKICLSAVSKMYTTCALMHNARRVCLYGTPTSTFFRISALIQTESYILDFKFEPNFLACSPNCK